jgi:hypothetical protein
VGEQSKCSGKLKTWVRIPLCLQIIIQLVVKKIIKGCVDCETKYPNFNRIKYQNWDKIKEEIDKCVLLCSNYHRLRHSLIGVW